MKKLLYFSIFFTIIFSTSFPQAQWQPLGSPSGGNISSITEKDGYIFTAVGQYWSAGAIYRSDDNGKTWSLKINNLPVDFIILDLASNSSYVYASASSGNVYRSSDYGESWELSLSGLTSSPVYTIHADGNNIYAGCFNSVYKSTNNGDDWTNIGSGFDDLYTYAITTVGDYLFIGTSDGVYRSFAGGNLEEVNNGINAQYPFIHSFLFKDGILFTGLYNKVYKSTNMGNNWTEISTSFDGAYALKSFDNKIYKTNYYGLHYSTNNGVNWVTINNSAIVNQYLIDVHVSNNLILTGEKELSRSEDNGVTWNFSSTGIANRETGPIIEKDGIFYTSSENIIYKSFNNGLNWAASDTLPLYTNLSKFFIYEGYIFAAATSGFAFRSADGEVWEQMEILVSEFTVLNNYLFASRSNQYTGTIFRSTDLGLTWEELSTPMLGDVADIEAFNGELYIGGFNGLFKSNDNGVSWNPVGYSTIIDPQVQKLHVHNSYLFLSDVSSEGLYRTSNGSDWTFFQNSLENNFYNSFESYNNILITSTYNYGVLISLDNGEIWQEFSDGLPLVTYGLAPHINSIYAKDNQLFASVSRFSIWSTPLSPVPVELSSFTAEYSNNSIILNWQTETEINNRGFEIEKSNLTKKIGWESISFIEGKGTTSEKNNYSFTDKNLSAGKYSYRLKQIDFDGTFEYSDVVEVDVLLPHEFILEQNYPNPFNPTTLIRFHLPIETKVSVKIYNVLGKEVATLVNETKESGIHDIEFTNNGQFSSGIYFYTISTESFTDTKKFILLK